MALSPVVSLLLLPSVLAMNLDDVARKLLADLHAGHPAQAVARFDDTMRAAMPEAKLGATWRDIEARAGAFVSVERIDRTKTDKHEVLDVRCRFANGPLVVRLAFDPHERVAGLFVLPVAPAIDWKPPAYVKLEAFVERAVTVGTPPLQVGGTLTLPKGPGPFPIAVLVHGSGPNDRNAAVGAARPFQDLAWGLASRGVAVLRADKRTFAHPEWFKPDRPYTTRDEVVDGALDAIAVARAQPEVDAARVVVIAHSLGGYLLPRIVAASPWIAAAVSLAGAARPLDGLVIQQLDTVHASDELKAAARQSVERIRNPALQKGDVVELLGARVPATYFLDLRAYDPPALAATQRVPLYIAQGGRDYQVTGLDFERWKVALDERANGSAHSAIFKFYPSLNHLFQPGQGPSSPAEYARPGHVAEELVIDLAHYIATVPPNRPPPDEPHAPPAPPPAKKPATR